MEHIRCRGGGTLLRMDRLKTHRRIVGRWVLPPMDEVPPVSAALPMYQGLQAFYKKRDQQLYAQALVHLVDETKKGRMFGEWNDYRRLL